MIQATRQIGFIIPAQFAGKLGELQATCDLAADRLREAPHLAKVLQEWATTLRNLRTTIYFEPLPPVAEIEQIEVAQ